MAVHTAYFAPIREEKSIVEKALYCYLSGLHLPTGIAAAAREHLKAMRRAGVPICGKDTAIQNLNFFLRNELVGSDHEMNEASDNREEYHGPFEAMILQTTGDVVRHMGVPTGGFLVWELPQLPPNWAKQMNELDFIMTPSEFSKKIFLNGGVTKPVYVVPHPIDITLFNPDVPPITPGIERPETVFMCTAQWMPRKGVEDLLLAYLTEFTDKDSVALLLFVWGGSHGLLERQRMREKIVSIRRGLNIDNQPKIFFVGQHIPREAVPELYALSDVHVSASRGEGFGIPFFEAAASAKPTIVTGFGGQWDYLDDESSYRVEYDMEPAHGVGGIWRHYNASQQWARVRIKSLQEQMRRAHEEKSERLKKGQRSLEIVIDNLTHDKIGDQMKEILYSHIGKS